MPPAQPQRRLASNDKALAAGSCPPSHDQNPVSLSRTWRSTASMTEWPRSRLTNVTSDECQVRDMSRRLIAPQRASVEHASVSAKICVFVFVHVTAPRRLKLVAPLSVLSTPLNNATVRFVANPLGGFCRKYSLWPVSIWLNKNNFVPSSGDDRE